ncbi:MAG: putative Ig domain-containing protein [Leptospira sp.]|nr:DUF4215 domain-containing protein [Leptospira sp.]MBL0953452.1 putative Ig domain-containing protein [Leptospira sp.]
MKYPHLIYILFSLVILFGILGCLGKDNGNDLPVDLVALITASNATNSTTPPSNLSYAGNPFVFFRNAAISAKIPTFTGRVESCKSNVTLPAGISIGNTCNITGTATANQSATNYTISATNSFGSTSTTISIQVKDSVCGNGVIKGNEVCDDSNTFNGDSCNSTCSGT